MKRKAISKRLRFEVFSRDAFTCRYCGRQSDTVVMQVDHVIPVCQGGTNDLENLVTACVDCNAGKSGTPISQTVTTEGDRLRMAQEMQEQRLAAEMARSAADARQQRFQELVNFWCGVTGNKSVNTTTIKIIFRYVQEYGEGVVYEWIERAEMVCSDDVNMGMYISGIRRSVKAQEEAGE